MVRISLVISDELDTAIKLRAIKEYAKNKKTDPKTPKITQQMLLADILEKEFKTKK